jgi:hypothetical protein
MIHLFSLSLALGVGCGSSGNFPARDGSSGSPDGFSGSPDAAGTMGAIDCNWLTGPNCYKSTFAPAVACLPDSKATGTLSVDGKTCTYASGQVITFSTPLTLPVPSGTLLNFTMTTGGGSLCLSVQQTTKDTFGIATSAGAFAWAVTGDTAAAVCPDKSTYVATGSALLQAEVCASKSTGSPATSLSSDSTSVQYWLDGTGVGSTQLLPIFNCQM